MQSIIKLENAAGNFNAYLAKPKGRPRGGVIVIHEVWGLNDHTKSIADRLAVHEPRLKLALPFYGHANFTVEQLAGIKCPVRAFYGQRDEALMQALPNLKAQMAEAKVDFEAKIYPDCGHAFFNDTNKFAYNQPATKDAWDKVLAELSANL